MWASIRLKIFNMLKPAETRDLVRQPAFFTKIFFINRTEINFN